MNPHRGLLHHMNINVSDVKRSARFYGPLFEYLGYERTGFNHEGDGAFEDWKRWLDGTPHEISIVQAIVSERFENARRRAVGHHNHIAFCAADRSDVDGLYDQVLVPLEKQGLCDVEDPPCDCPEYGDGYYATFFFDPDGLKFEFVTNPNYFTKKKVRDARIAGRAVRVLDNDGAHPGEVAHNMIQMKIDEGGLNDLRVQELLAHHFSSARAQTAPGSAHALDLSGLKGPDVLFWSAWDGDAVVGIGALKRLSVSHGEIKSMHTNERFRRKGVGGKMLRHIISEARKMGLSKLSLEPGSWPYFLAARQLYARHGFVECLPFGDYVADLNSIFMTLHLV